MKFQIFTVKDLAVGAFGRPMFMQSKGQALRSFSDEVNRPADDNQMFKHPEDFSLFYLGEWDEESGYFSSGDPEFMTSASTVFISKE